jgi:hypothetical protein
MNEHSKTTAIVLLALTATIMLSTLLIIQHMPAREAQALGPLERQGDYIILPGESDRGADNVFVIDLAVAGMIAYRLDGARGRVEIEGVFNLKKLP